MKELCWQDAEYRWHGILLQSRPHSGLQEFVGYYGLIRDFIRLSEDKGKSSVSRRVPDKR